MEQLARSPLLGAASAVLTYTGPRIAMGKGTATRAGGLAIRRLAEWAPRLRAEDEAVQADPTALRQLIDVARRHGSEAMEKFQATVHRSIDMLSPLGEPLTVLDFSAHRWLGGHREEAYSDWLQWLLAQADALDVLAVFGVGDPDMVLACRECSVTIDRERWVGEGHDGSSGRLDLEIQFGDEA